VISLFLYMLFVLVRYVLLYFRSISCVPLFYRSLVISLCMCVRSLFPSGFVYVVRYLFIDFTVSCVRAFVIYFFH